MASSVPKEIQEVGFDFWWDSKKVWQLDVPVTEMGVKQLAWHFAYPFCTKVERNTTSNPLTSNSSAEHQVEYDRTMAADLSYPIDVMDWKGRWLILDGLHRLVKAAIQKQTTVRVRIIPREHILDIIHDRAIKEHDPKSMHYIKVEQ